MLKKFIAYDADARSKFLSGVNKVGAYVGSTLGHKGRNWIIQEKFSAPHVSNDGVTVARSIVLNDEMEDLAAQTVVDIAMKTDQEAGDGTTTSVVIADALITRGYKELEMGEMSDVTAVSIAEKIYEERPKVIKKLTDQAKKLKKGELQHVITTSLRDKDLGKKVADLLEKVGVDGRIAVEDNWQTKRETEIEEILGMKFLGRSASPFLSNTENGKDSVWKDAYVLVTNEKLEIFTTIKHLTDEMKQKGKTKLVLINGFSEGNASYSKQVIKAFVIAMDLVRQKGEGVALEVLAIDAPSLTSAQLEDIAVFTGAKFIDKDIGNGLIGSKFTDLGYAKEVSVSDDVVNVMGGKGNTKERIEMLRKQMDMEKDVMFKNKFRDRIASLSAAQGIIWVGAPTEAEQTFFKEKITDAVNAGRAALLEGVIKGGGIPLKEIAESLGEEHILYEALMAPYKTIQKNAGGKLKVADDILDPVKVTRLAFENALSASAQIIACVGGITDKREGIWDKWEKVVEKQFPDLQADFRHESNQDQGRPRT
jgi:chaperonin GroEL